MSDLERKDFCGLPNNLVYFSFSLSEFFNLGNLKNKIISCPGGKETNGGGGSGVIQELRLWYADVAISSGIFVEMTSN